MKTLLLERRPSGRYLLVGAVVCLIATSCGTQPINAQSPLYVLANDSGQLTVEVVNQSNYQIAGKIQIVSDGDTPPTGAIAAEAGGQVLVTYTGVDVGQQLQIKPNTVACSLATSNCNTIWSGWGSATATTLDDSSILVPGWNGVNFNSGQLGFFGGKQLGLQRQVPLANSAPGPIASSGDGRNVYWLTFTSPSGAQAPEQWLLRVDTATGKVLSKVGFGKRLPFAVAVSSDGEVLVSVLYDQAPVPPGVGGTPPVPGVLGSSVEVFSPDLSTSRTLRVQQGPTLVAAGQTSLLVAATTSRIPSVDLVDLKTGAPRPSPEIPAGWTLSGLDVIKLAGGEEAGILELNSAATDHFRLGVVDLATGAVKWHEYPGQILGSVAA